MDKGRLSVGVQYLLADMLKGELRAQRNTKTSIQDSIASKNIKFAFRGFGLENNMRSKKKKNEFPLFPILFRLFCYTILDGKRLLFLIYFCSTRNITDLF